MGSASLSSLPMTIFSYVYQYVSQNKGLWLITYLPFHSQWKQSISWENRVGFNWWLLWFGVCSLVPWHSFDSGSRNCQYSSDFLWALGSVCRCQAHHIDYWSVLVQGRLYMTEICVLLWLLLWLPPAAWGLWGQVLLLVTAQGGSRFSMACLKDLQKWIWIHWDMHSLRRVEE